MTQAIVHSLESFGSVDGPGVRYVIFLQGCKMRCKFCHNPETWKCYSPEELMQKTTHADKSVCGSKPAVDSLQQPKLYTAEELYKIASRYKPFWGKNSEKGGITVSGGEPLLQIDFLIEFFELCKANGVHTALDTSGQPFDRSSKDFMDKFDRLMKVTDLFLLDLKAFDNEIHKVVTGVGNTNILQMAEYLSANGKPMWVRHVLVPGLTDKDEDLKEMHDFLDGLATVEKIEILPYHTLGLIKYEKLGIRYPLGGVEPPSTDAVHRAERFLGIDVVPA